MKDTWFVYLRSPKAERLTLHPTDEDGVRSKIPVNRYIPKDHPLACLAVRTTAVENNRQRLAVGMSLWNPLDAYNKRKARGLATSRAIRSPFVVTIDANTSYYDANKVILELLSLTPFNGSKPLPKRVRAAIKTTLEATNATQRQNPDAATQNA